MSATNRVTDNTADAVNQRIENATRRRIRHAGGETPSQISRRIEALEHEWDIERVLETNASALAFGGLVLGLFHNRKFLWIPALVLPFLFQHAVQGWCPPVPFLRRRGVPPRREMDAEKRAPKPLRGDIADAAANGEPRERARFPQTVARS